MQQPTIGRIVIVPVDPTRNNGSTLAPAIITRVWNIELINVKVLLDGPDNDWKTSVRLFPDADALWENHDSDASNPPHGAYWPVVEARA